MRRIITVALLALGGTFAMSGVASADIGDVRFLSIDEELFGSASEVEMTGTIRCAATIEYGLWAAVAQDGEGNFTEGTFNANEGGPGPSSEDDEEPVEGVGAYGPNFDPPVGVSDDSPCSQSLQSYDVLIQQNRDSGDFDDGTIEVFLQAGTSAENGGRGPGPFIGDTFGLEGWSDFERTR